jgi:hypothetical protein
MYFKALVQPHSKHPNNGAVCVAQEPDFVFIESGEFLVGEEILQFLAFSTHTQGLEGIAGLPAPQM